MTNDFVDLGKFKKDKEEEITGFKANPDSLIWEQVISNEEGEKTTEKCVGSFGFLQTETEPHLAMVFVVYKDDDPKQAIAIPRYILETALSQGWFPKRGNKR
tara:strand:- start:17517 stop:17822 length:306 start_codon:yes stop_codon:yes gene_type:complete